MTERYFLGFDSLTDLQEAEKLLAAERQREEAERQAAIRREEQRQATEFARRDLDAWLRPVGGYWGYDSYEDECRFDSDAMMELHRLAALGKRFEDRPCKDSMNGCGA